MHFALSLQLAWGKLLVVINPIIAFWKWWSPTVTRSLKRLVAFQSRQVQKVALCLMRHLFNGPGKAILTPSQSVKDQPFFLECHYNIETDFAWQKEEVRKNSTTMKESGFKTLSSYIWMMRQGNIDTRMYVDGDPSKFTPGVSPSGVYGSYSQVLSFPLTM